VNVDLDQRRVTDCFETVDFASLDDEYVSRAAFEGLAADSPDAAAFSNELDLVIRMAMWTGPRTRLAMKQEYRNVGVTLLGSAKLMRTADKGQVFLSHVMHRVILLLGLDEGGCG
jgi:hypothetical protein